MLRLVTDASGHTTIARAFADPHLEVCRLLREAANIEHALLVQYLYAAFSIKPKYAELAGGTFDSATTLLGIAVQEMRHLAVVNTLLVALSAEPNLDREDFPIVSDIYPCPLELEQLTRTSIAKYLVAESPAGALDPSPADSAADEEFKHQVTTSLGKRSINHIGSLYTEIIARVQELVAADAAALPGSDAQIQALERVRANGEVDHFLFFKSTFTGTHPALVNPNVWDNPRSDDYPSTFLPTNPTAFPGQATSIADPTQRSIGWLSNLQYWIVLNLLYLGHNNQTIDYVGRAEGHMIGCLYPIGRDLALRGIGLPFDALALNFDLGIDDASSKAWLVRLLKEARALEASLAASLPLDYSGIEANASIQALGGVI
jgi:rubrerythrin